MHFIKTVNNFLTSIECDNIVRSFSNIELVEAQVGSGKKGAELKKVRDSEIQFIKVEWIRDKLEILLREEIRLKGFELDDIEDFQFTKYDVGGHYDWHTDTGKNFQNRFCSIVIQLNDEYVGGELQCKDINNNDMTFESGIGNMFIFNSNIEHKVNPIVSGIRYSLVTWIKLREIKEFKKTLL